jgi:hypothetical protein
MEGAWVAAVTVTVCALVPFRVIEGGEEVQVERAGAPVQFTEICSSKPPRGARLRV